MRRTTARQARRPGTPIVPGAVLAAVVAALLAVGAGSARAADLNVTTLRVRLHDTPAMGLVTKLGLRREIADLVRALAAFHEGRGERSLEVLHGTYTTLVAKTLQLLDGADTDLARDLASSRDRIWDELADPVRFAALEHT